MLLKKRENIALASSVAPENDRLGVMLPYTPLHCLLLEPFSALVMTSGNVSDRPMLFRDEDAQAGLLGLADAVLTHNRPIVRRMDDSVCVVSVGQPRFLRRARGWAPEPLPLPKNKWGILAVGAQQKNTFALAKGDCAFLSGHIGDLDDPETETDFVSETASFERLFDAKPDCVACDLHPDYLSTRFAHSLHIPVVAIQHHHAHFASVLAEQGTSEPAIGFIWDGTGDGGDGTVWGGETLFGTIGESRRIGHLLPFRLLGGEAAVREPWRAALAVCALALGRERAVQWVPAREKEAALLLSAADAGLNAYRPRAWDGCSTRWRRCGLREGLPTKAGGNRAGTGSDESEQDSTVCALRENDVGLRLAAGCSRADRGCGTRALGRAHLMRFHRALAALLPTRRKARRETGCNCVALSGGVLSE